MGSDCSRAPGFHWGDRNVRITWRMYRMSLNCTLELVNLILCEFHQNEQ